MHLLPVRTISGLVAICVVLVAGIIACSSSVVQAQIQLVGLDRQVSAQEASLLGAPTTTGVWNAPNALRSSYSGPIFHILHDGPDAANDRVAFQYSTAGTIYGRPANLALRVFDPDDNLVLVQDLSQAVAGTYTGLVDLTDANLPRGRYRYVFTGEFDDGSGESLRIAPGWYHGVGVAGGYAMGLTGERSDWYFHVPDDVDSFSIYASSPTSSDEVVSVFNGQNQSTLVGSSSPVRRSSSGWSQLSFDNLPAGSDRIWRLNHDSIQGDNGRLRLLTEGLPGVLWGSGYAASVLGPDVTYLTDRIASGPGGQALTRRVDHRWQARLLEPVISLESGDFQTPAWSSNAAANARIDALSDEEALRAVVGMGLYGPLNSATALFGRQITQGGSVYTGFIDNEGSAVSVPGQPLNPSQDFPGKMIQYAHGLASLYRHEFGTADVGGSSQAVSPFYNDPGVRNRAVAAFAQAMTAISEQQTLFEQGRTISGTGGFVPDNNAFVYLGHYAQTFRLLEDALAPEAREAAKTGLVELYGRYANFRSYQTNQWSHIILGLQGAAVATNDPLLNKAFHEQVDLLVTDATNTPTHGQSSAGFYRENGGLDGNYSTLTEYNLGMAYRQEMQGQSGPPPAGSTAEKLRDSLEKELDLKGHLLVTLPNGRLVGSRNWNHRTDSSLVSGFPAERLLAQDFGVAARLLQGQAVASPNSPWNVTDPDVARALLKSGYGDTYNFSTVNGVRVQLAGALGGDLYEHTTGTFASPTPLGAESSTDRVRHFGSDPDDDRFVTGKFDEWYGILYSGSQMVSSGDIAPGGSGLSTLWHEAFGPVILSDTKYTSSGLRSGGPPLTITDELTVAGQRLSTLNEIGSPDGDLAFRQLTHSLMLGSDDSIAFTRQYHFEADRVVSTVEGVGSGASDWHLFLPVVDSDFAKVKAIGRDAPQDPDAWVSLAAGLSLSDIRGLYWKGVGDEDHLIMTFPDALSVSLEVVARETFGSDPLQVYVLDLDFGDLGRPNWVLQRVDDPTAVPEPATAWWAALLTVVARRRRRRNQR